MGYYDRDRGRSFTTPAGGTEYASGQMGQAYSHHGNVSEYQSSGVPFVHTFEMTDTDFTSVTTKHKDVLVTVQFPFVTRWLMIYCYKEDGGNGNQTAITTAKIGFGNYDEDEGVQGNEFVRTEITNQVRMELKCNKFYVVMPGSLHGTSNNGKYRVEVIAGLTNVPHSEFPNLNERYLSGITSSLKNGSRDVSTPTLAANTAIAFAVSDTDDLTTTS